MSNTASCASSSKQPDTSQYDAIHVKNGECVGESSSAFTQDELKFQRVIFQITLELKRNFSTFPNGECSTPQINYWDAASCQIIYLVTRPYVGPGNLCIGIKLLDNNMWEFSCMFGSFRTTPVRKGYTRNMSSKDKKTPHVSVLKHIDGDGLDHQDVVKLCSDIMNLRDIVYIDIPNNVEKKKR